MNEVLLLGRQSGSNSSGVPGQASGGQHSFKLLDEVVASAVDVAAELGLGRHGATRRRQHRREQTPWQVDSIAAYCQDVEPRVHPERAAQAVPAGLGESPDAAGDAEVIEWGSHRMRWPWSGARAPVISVALTALVAGLVLGFAGGYLRATANGRPARAAASAATMFAAGDPLIDTGNRCAVQLGHTLQLGVEVVNQSDRAVALRQIEPVLPLGGLKAVASGWGTCGALREPGPGGPATSLAAGATGWLTVTFDVMVSCPEPLSVQFKIGYVQAGRLLTAEFAGFPDLGQVQYDNCSTNSQGY